MNGDAVPGAAGAAADASRAGCGFGTGAVVAWTSHRHHRVGRRPSTDAPAVHQVPRTAMPARPHAGGAAFGEATRGPSPPHVAFATRPDVVLR